MKTSYLAIPAAIFLFAGLPSQDCRACGTPPPDPPCIGFFNNTLVLQLGTIFPTNSISQCACGIGLVNPPAGLNFSRAEIGVVNGLTNSFTPTFQLDRDPNGDSPMNPGDPPGPWDTGTDLSGKQSVTGAKWFGFSNPGVPPVTPPTLGLGELYAISFEIATPFDPALLEGLTVQYGSGAATPSGLPDFIHNANPAHAAAYSMPVSVPTFGTSNWVPEPTSSLVYLCLAMTFSMGRRGRMRRA